MYTLKEGISVLICAHNSSEKLKQTLTHLANQQVDENILWEVIFVDNASTDQTKNNAKKIWCEIGSVVPMHFFDEPRKGKDRAIDLGLSKAQYSYVIICDDDNWLCDTYINQAYHTMKDNPEIGILGGQSVAVFESTPPEWFSLYQKYYAIGKQNIVTGEIQHYWPKYRFLWGAGAVINMQAYSYLKECGFTRILTSDRYPKVARSEDVELCFAIWLAGYKVWYKNELLFHHYIPSDRLQWSYLMNIMKQGTSAIHYLLPYQIFIFARDKYRPTSSLWTKYIGYHSNKLLKLIFSFRNLNVLFRLFRDRHVENDYYFKRARKKCI
jgi:glycosyltransferase involved in cell wall biosynthesis